MSNFRPRNKLANVPKDDQDSLKDSGTLFSGLFSEEGIIKKSDDDDDDDADNDVNSSF